MSPLNSHTLRAWVREYAPFLLRYLLPLVVITAVCLGLMHEEAPLLPSYDIEAFGRRTPYSYIGSFNRDFNDLNDLQLSSASVVGIRPCRTREEVRQHKKLVPVSDSKGIIIDELTHSEPYLVPEAARLLEDLGESFVMRLQRDRMPLYRLVVTSITRTEEDVRALRRGNANASAKSTHMYGTTFDVSWKRFEKVDPEDPREIAPDELKHLLASVLRTYQKEGRCYIKHERLQACFHMTVRKVQ